MRTWPVEQFRKIMGNYTTAAPSEVLVLGSDADEIATGEAVWRLSRCELRGAPALDEWTVYFGALETKYTADSLEALADGPCAADQQEPRELARAVWGSGPVARTLARVLREEVSPRAPPAQFGCNARPWKTKKVPAPPPGPPFVLCIAPGPLQPLCPPPPPCPHRCCAQVPLRDALGRAGASEAASQAVRQAVGGGCQSGWGRLLSVTNAIEAGTWRQGDSGWA